MIGDALPLLVVVGLVAVASFVLRRQSGVARADHDLFAAADLAEIGFSSDRHGFVIFTAPGCTTCRPARAVLDDVAAREGLMVVAVDASRHPDLAARHHILRAPTTLVLQPGGRVAARVHGVPHAADLTTWLPSSVDAAA